MNDLAEATDVEQLPAFRQLSANHKLFVYLCAIFVACLLLGDVIGGKTIATPLGAISVGILPFPVTFLLTDIVNDFYGAKGARFLTLLGFWMAVLATGMLFYVGLLIDLLLWVVVAVMVHRNAQSIGKKLCGIKVARTDGSRATLGRIFWLRNVANYVIRFVPAIGPLYGLVDILMIFGEQRRCCHDYIADTIVVQA